MKFARIVGLGIAIGCFAGIGAAQAHLTTPGTETGKPVAGLDTANATPAGDQLGGPTHYYVPPGPPDGTFDNPPD